MPTIRIDGFDIAVTQAWHDQVIAPRAEFGEMNLAELEAERQRIQQLDNTRAQAIKRLYASDAEFLAAHENGELAPTLSEEEQHRLDMVTHVINVHLSARWCQGRPHAAFGFEGMDQVHGGSITHDCGCVTQHVVDHHKAFALSAAADVLEAHPDPVIHARRAKLWAHAAALAGLKPHEHHKALAHEPVHVAHAPQRVCKKHREYRLRGLQAFNARVIADQPAPSDQEV